MGSTSWPRPPLWPPTPSSTTAPWTSTRPSSRRPSPMWEDQRTWSYWFMLELFTDSDTNKCGLVKYSEFAHMMFQLVMTAKKHGLTTPAEDQYETIFKKYDPRGNGTLTIDEWIKLATEEVFKTIV